MVDPRIAWFAAGTLLGALLFGSPLPLPPCSNPPPPRRRRGSNPPPPGRKPAPSAGAPLVASRADAERLAALLQENAKQLIVAGYANSSEQLRDLGLQVCWAAIMLGRKKPIHLDEDLTQRGDGDGGPATPKPPIKPQPAGPRLVGDSIKPPPIKPEFPPPQEISEDFL